MSASEKRTFFDLVPSAWFDDGAYANVKVVLFASSVAGNVELASAYAALTKCAQAIERHPVSITGIILEGADPIPSVTYSVTYPNGGRTCNAEINSITPPPGGYFLVASPHLKAGDGVNEGDAERAIAVARAFLALTFGHTSVEERTIIFVLETDQQKISAASPVLEMHLAAQDFRFLPDQILYQLADRSEYLSTLAKERIALAMTFASRAVNELDQVIRFSHLWMALEVSTGGKPARSLKRLQGSQTLTGVLKALEATRNELFHKGIRRQIPQMVERIMFLAIAAEFLSLTGATDSEIHDLYIGLSNALSEQDLEALPMSAAGAHKG